MKNPTIIYILVQDFLEGETYIPIHRSFQDIFGKGKFAEFPEHGLTLEKTGEDSFNTTFQDGFKRVRAIGWLNPNTGSIIETGKEQRKKQ